MGTERWQLCLDQGKWREWRQKCITVRELLLKPSQVDVSASHTAPGASSGALRVTYIPEKSRFQLAGHTVEQFLLLQRANLKSRYLAWNDTMWLKCINTIFAVKSSPTGKTSNQVVVSLTDFNKNFNSAMVISIRKVFLLQTVKFKASSFDIV